jgi:hypothetical protein
MDIAQACDFVGPGAALARVVPGSPPRKEGACTETELAGQVGLCLLTLTGLKGHSSLFSLVKKTRNLSHSAITTIILAGIVLCHSSVTPHLPLCPSPQGIMGVY